MRIEILCLLHFCRPGFRTLHIPSWSSKDLQVLRICRSQRLDMGLKRVMWVRRYQGQCRALRPLGHQGYRLRSYNKDQPLCSGYMRCVCRAPLFKCTHSPDLKDQSQLHFLCSPYTSIHTYSRAHALKHCACAYTRVSASTRTLEAQALQCIYARNSNFLIQSKSLKCQKQGKGACSCNL